MSTAHKSRKSSHTVRYHQPQLQSKKSRSRHESKKSSTSSAASPKSSKSKKSIKSKKSRSHASSSPARSHHFHTQNHPSSSSHSSAGGPRKSRIAKLREKNKDRFEWKRCSKREEKLYWNLNAVEYNFEMQRAVQQKYCQKCDKRGEHSTQMCNVYSPDDFCFVCGNEHMGQRCDANRCSVCSLNHHRSNCQVPIHKLHCTICNQAGHLDIMCSNNWRIFAFDPNVDLLSSPIVNCKPQEKATKKACPNCGSNKHFYSDCPQLTMSTFKHRTYPLTFDLDERNVTFERNLDLIQSLQPQFNQSKRRGSDPKIDTATKKRSN